MKNILKQVFVYTCHDVPHVIDTSYKKLSEDMESWYNSLRNEYRVITVSDSLREVDSHIIEIVFVIWLERRLIPGQD